MFQQCLCTCEPMVAVRASYPMPVLLPCLQAMFMSARAMPLHVPACGGRACIVSNCLWYSCHVYKPCFSNAFARATLLWPCVHRIGLHVVLLQVFQSCFSNAFARASPWWPCVHRIRCLYSCHVYKPCLCQPEQCLCTCQPVVAVRASYPIACGTPAMFTSHVAAMPLRVRHCCGRACTVLDCMWCSCKFSSHVSATPLHVRAHGGRACIVSDACTPAMFTSHVYVSPSCQCGPKELPKPRHSAKLRKHAAVDAGLCVWLTVYNLTKDML